MTEDRTPLLASSPEEEQQQRIQSYTEITTRTTNELENGHDPTIHKTIEVEQKTTIWRSLRSKAYLRSIIMLVLFFVIFTGLEIALLKLNLPAVGPYVSLLWLSLSLSMQQNYILIISFSVLLLSTEYIFICFN